MLSYDYHQSPSQSIPTGGQSSSWPTTEKKDALTQVPDWWAAQVGGPMKKKRAVDNKFK
jgi:hypothetical protein